MDNSQHNQDDVTITPPVFALTEVDVDDDLLAIYERMADDPDRKQREQEDYELRLSRNQALNGEASFDPEAFSSYETLAADPWWQQRTREALARRDLRRSDEGTEAVEDWSAEAYAELAQTEEWAETQRLHWARRHLRHSYSD